MTPKKYRRELEETATFLDRMRTHANWTLAAMAFATGAAL